MGLFSKKKNEEETRNPYIVPQNATTNWFRTVDGKNFFEMLRREKEYDPYYFRWFWQAYIQSFNNFAQLERKYSDTDRDMFTVKHVISYWLTIYSIHKEKDEFGDNCFTYTYDDILDDAILYYIEHMKFGMTNKVSKIILSLLGTGQVDTEKDVWLYDEKIFGHDSETDVLTALKKIISEYGYTVDINAPCIQNAY